MHSKINPRKLVNVDTPGAPGDPITEVTFGKRSIEVAKSLCLKLDISDRITAGLNVFGSKRIYRCWLSNLKLFRKSNFDSKLWSYITTNESF
ncbi:unannotated protein [freshwater metagenome]|uniref:Unannotated protein n=1 Tax=freshwater metagenome TaxID=449393 RepID=A0A6J6JAU1_9ZZZZ